MSTYSKTFRSIWQDDDFRSLPALAQRLYWLLYSQPDVSHCGVLPLTPGRWGQLADDTDADSVRRDIDRLANADFVVVDYQTEELLIRSYVKWDEGYRVPNIRKALVRSVAEVLSVPLRNTLGTLLETLGVTLEERVGPSQQQQPATAAFTGSQQQHRDRPPNGSRNSMLSRAALPAAAAAAIDALIEHKVLADAPRVPDRYRTTLRRNLPEEHRDALNTYLSDHPDATPLMLATSVLHMSPADADAYLTETIAR